MQMNQFDPVPACFSGVQFLPVPRLERIVRDKLVRYERESGIRLTLPIDIESLVEVMEKIAVDYFDRGHPEFDSDILGAYDFVLDKMFIRDSIQHSGRRRFTWAHEYGHYVLHRPHFLQSVFDFYEDTKAYAVQVHRGEGITRNKLEWQANAFAGHMLMPTALVRELIGSSPDRTDRTALLLAEAAEVSIQAARIRLDQLLFD